MRTPQNYFTANTFLQQFVIRLYQRIIKHPFLSIIKQRYCLFNAKSFMPTLNILEIRIAPTKCISIYRRRGCLVLYPESVWNERLDLLKSQLRPWMHTHQQIFRQFVSEAEVVTLDGNGRFLISKRLMKVAEIEQDIQFIGMDNTIEIWAPEKLKQTLKSEEEFGIEFENIMNISDNL